MSKNRQISNEVKSFGMYGIAERRGVLRPYLRGVRPTPINRFGRWYGTQLFGPLVSLGMDPADMPGAPGAQCERGRQRRLRSSFFSGLQIWCAAQLRPACSRSRCLRCWIDAHGHVRSRGENATHRGAAHCAESLLWACWPTERTWRASRPPRLCHSLHQSIARHAPPLRILGAVLGRPDCDQGLLPSKTSKLCPPGEPRP